MIQLPPHLAKVYRCSEISEDRDPYVGLDRNERVTPWSAKEFRGLLGALKPVHLCHYPDAKPFYTALSKSVGLPASCLYATSGSDAAIRMIFHSFVQPGSAVIFPSPSYAMYDVYGKIFQGRIQTLPYNDDLMIDRNRLRQMLRRRPRLLVIANPDQPTGSVLGEKPLLEILRAAKSRGTIVVVDEAYFPFYPHSMIRHVRTFDNLIVTRSFSKSGGIAGLRLGFMAARPELIDRATRVHGAFEVNAVAYALGTYLLKHPQLMRSQLKSLEEGRTTLLEFADRHAIGYSSCPTNFQLLQFAGMAKTDRLVALLKKEGYLVKGSFSMPALRDCIRVTLAGPEVIRPFTAALKRCLVKVGWIKR